MRTRLLALVLLIPLGACAAGGGSSPTRPATATRAAPGSSDVVSASGSDNRSQLEVDDLSAAADQPQASSAAPHPSRLGAKAPDRISVPLRVESRVRDVPTAQFVDWVLRVLTDDRGWRRAGFEFSFVESAPYHVVLAEPSEVDGLCAPYRTGGLWSCQNGPVVALNADRWRSASPAWPASLEDYRTMLVNHEVGHLLGQHHPKPLCAAGNRSPLMAQQSKGTGACLPNAWPLKWEIACAARHEEPLAPGPSSDVAPTCGP